MIRGQAPTGRRTADTADGLPAVVPAAVPAPARAVAASILAACRPQAGVARRPSIVDLTDFQAEAVQAARAILDRWGGVIVADSVGLGKTYVGLALLEHALRAGNAGVVAVPAALRRTWRPGLERLRRATGCSVPLVSHTQLARGTPDLDIVQNFASDRAFRAGRRRLLVLVDEAHAFRNRRTKRYRALARLCRGARVVLLTATPINNSVMDLYALIRLFARDDAFRDLGVPALRAAFRSAAARAAPADAARIEPILPVVQAVVIRRTRPFIRDRYGAVRLPGPEGKGLVLHFPRRAPPDPIRYPLFEDPEDFGRMAADLLALRFAPLAALRQPGRASADAPRAPVRARDGPRSPGGVAELMRLSLLKRLESGRHAFRTSVERQLGFHEAFADALWRGYLLPARLHRALAGDGETMQLLLEPMALEPLPTALDRDRLAAGTAEDIARLRAMRDRARTPDRDGKLDALLALIRTLAGRKLVVFTEFRDTAAYLWRALLAAGCRTGRVDGAGSFLGREQAGRRVVVDRFAPRANHAREPPPHERVDVLVATDVLAEGLDLQDAAHVLSYDLPWNPVRLIQRVGRIDRLGSPHDVVHPHFLLPGPELERLLGLHARIRAKLAAIGATVGLDGTVLDHDGSRDSVAQRLARGDPGVLDELERAEAAPLCGWREPDDAVRLGRSRPAGPLEWRAAVSNAVPVPAVFDTASVPSAPVGPGPSLVAVDVDGSPLWLVVEGEAARVDDEAARAILRGALECGEDTDLPDSAASVLASALDEIRRRRAPDALPALRDPHAPPTRAARWLRALLARERTEPLDPALADQVDEVMRRLARPLDAVAEARIEDVLRTRADQAGQADQGAQPGWREGRPGPDGLERAVLQLARATDGSSQGESGAGAVLRAPRIRWIGALIGHPPDTA